ncbi:helix-turn-helix domain-containing protein [Nonomuraea rubra]
MVTPVDLDLAQVRTFVQAAEELPLGRTAEELSISQQALSKRIPRLEFALGSRPLNPRRPGGAPHRGRPAFPGARPASAGRRGPARGGCAGHAPPAAAGTRCTAAGTTWRQRSCHQIHVSPFALVN